MPALDQLPPGTRVEFRAFADWKGYASAMGYHPTLSQRNGPAIVA